MGATLRIETTEQATSTVVHRFRNFGEDVYRELRDSCTVSIEEIDRSTTVFTVRDVHTRRVKTVTRAILELARRHGFSATAVVTRVSRRAARMRRDTKSWEALFKRAPVPPGVAPVEQRGGHEAPQARRYGGAA